MNASYAWLKSMVPALAGSPQEIADRLAMLGAPVDAVVDLGGPLRDILIARVLDARRHPNADRLSLCSVDAGTGEALSVVCGAPNVRAGAFYPFIPAGGTLPDGVTIRRSKIRGEVSNGMLCSPREIGLGRDHEGILELHGEFTPGASFTEQVGLDDWRIEIDVTPNRPDLLSHWGIARELSPDGEISLRLPPVPGLPVPGPTDALRFATGPRSAGEPGLAISIDNPDGCSIYMAAILRGVTIGPSPEWLASRLRAIGARPINNVVDATNWVLFELGQPLHGFDLGRAGQTIVVRSARPGETLTTLDGEKRSLDREILVIADAERPIALAGIMGGLDTEVTAATSDVLLECALFSPQVIRAGRRRLGMSTDASYRFERGVDPDTMERAVRRAIDLIRATAGGQAEPSVVVAGEGVPEPAVVGIRSQRAEQVLGQPFTVGAIRALLEPIGFATVAEHDASLDLRVPGHRRYDVSREVDLIEEVARRKGYDAFPDEVRAFRTSSVKDHPMSILEDRLRDRMVARGLLESRGMPLVAESDGDIELLLPLASTESRLRRSLLPGLFRRFETNYNRGARDIRLFEIGTAFQPGEPEGLPVETTRLALALGGRRAPDHWTAASPAFDIWDLRGLLEELATALALVLHAAEPEGSHPFVPSAAFRLATADGTVVGSGGCVRDGVIDAPVWADPVFAAEFRLLDGTTIRAIREVTALPAHPAVERDVALVVPVGIPAATIQQTIGEAGGALLVSVVPFDVYTGDRLAVGSRSIAFRMRFRADDRTLTVDEVDTLVDRILERLRSEHHAERRG
jgi:phenylalanyl-tRNA synthetase beta chain